MESLDEGITMNTAKFLIDKSQKQSMDTHELTLSDRATNYTFWDDSFERVFDVVIEEMNNSIVFIFVFTLLDHSEYG